jgi:hypothetical protein
VPYYLAYVSSATRLLSADELHELLETCRAINAARQVTGALLYQDGNFMQVIEGERDVIETLYETITRDSRHRNLTVLIRGTTPEPQFGAWSMAFADLSTADTELARGYSRFFHTGSDAADFGDHPTVGQRLLLSFRRSLDARHR